MKTQTSMKIDDTDIKTAQGLAQARLRQLATVQSAIDLFHEADTPEARAEAATHLIAVDGEACVAFNEEMCRVADRVSRGNREMELVERAFGTNVRESVV